MDGSEMMDRFGAMIESINEDRKEAREEEARDRFASGIMRTLLDKSMYPGGGGQVPREKIQSLVAFSWDVADEMVAERARRTVQRRG